MNLSMISISSSSLDGCDFSLKQELHGDDLNKGSARQLETSFPMLVLPRKKTLEERSVRSRLTCLACQKTMSHTRVSKFCFHLVELKTMKEIVHSAKFTHRLLIVRQ
jgi:hypothetical protein